MSFLQRIFGRVDRRATVEPLYRAIVAVGRDPGWYRDGHVADTIDGRFDMLAAVTALVMLRLEDEGESGREPSVLLAELFIDDMDATLRQIGIGDYVVGKHVGKLMGALGGRLTAFRAVRAGEEAFEGAVSRNVFHEAPPSEAALRWVAGRLERFGKALSGQRLEDLLAGRIAAL